MGNLVGTLKKFISNKNTVTILVVIAGIIVLWYFYNSRVNSAITTIKIPYATERVNSGYKIDTEKISTKEITKSTLKDSDIVTSLSELEGKYICVRNAIPKNGFFYKSQLCNREQIQNRLTDSLQDGWTLYGLDVNMRSTYANSILQDSYIDLYLSAVDGDEIIFGSLIKGIKVLDVRDGNGKSLFWDASAGNSSQLLFAVPDDLFRLLTTATELISSNSIDVFPVIRSTGYCQSDKENCDADIANLELEAFILRKLKTLDTQTNANA